MVRFGVLFEVRSEFLIFRASAASKGLKMCDIRNKQIHYITTAVSAGVK
jgi:hypothetical protein